MKTWLHNIKKVTTFCVGLATLGMPVFVFQSYVKEILEEYENLKIWLPIHPYTASIASALPYITILGLTFYLIKKKRSLGQLNLFFVVLLILALGISIQIAMRFYIISYR